MRMEEKVYGLVLRFLINTSLWFLPVFINKNQEDFNIYYIMFNETKTPLVFYILNVSQELENSSKSTTQYFNV